MGFASLSDLVASEEARSAPRSFWRTVKEFLTAVDPCPVPAVCLPPGARLRLEAIGADLRQRHGLDFEEEVSFEELTAAENTYRDAIAFRTGLRVRLQELPEGQLATVLSLTGAETDGPQAGWAVFAEESPRRRTLRAMAAGR